MTNGILLNGSADIDFMIHGVFPYQFFGQTVWITTTHICLLIVLLLILAFAIAANRAMKHASEVPGFFQNIVELVVEKLDGMVKMVMGKNATKFANYIGTIFIFILISNFSGLLGLRPPTADYGVTLPLGLATFTLIHYNKLKHKKLKVTSLMRDMYVEIPGYGKNKFNAAYSFGGIKLLYKTIASNFGIKLDGYAEVNFDAFIDVINAVGGVEATLTESEATNLNDTNYIRRKKYRNVKVGTQVLNGYQALGYCRIRHGKWKNGHYPAVLTASGKGDDYGRTERQRLVVQALLKKVKSLSVDKWMELIDVILPNVTTDLDKDSIYSYVLAVVKMGTTDIKQYHLPADGAYTSEKINGADCLVVDVEKNKKALSDFIYEK